MDDAASPRETPPADAASLEQPSRQRSYDMGFWRLAWRRMRKDPMAMTGLGIVAFLLLMAYFAPLIANNRPIVMHWQGKTYYPAVGQMFPFRLFLDYRHLDLLDYELLKTDPQVARLMPPIPHGPLKTHTPDKLQGPSSEYWLGTDDLGRDMLARVIHGTRVSLTVGFVAMGIAACIGILIGALAGFYGGWVDIALSRVIEVVMSFPSFFLIIAIVAFLPPRFIYVMIVIGLTSWTSIARYARGEFLKLKEQDFALAGRALGASDARIIFRHILPNALAPVLVSVTFGIAQAILIEAGLSFLGFGVQPPTPSWGGMLSAAQNYLEWWWITAFPGAAIFLAVTGYNMLGEGLRDATDPRLALRGR